MDPNLKRKSHTRTDGRLKKDLPDEVDAKLVIGIDFGTTFTKVAWGITSDAKVEIQVVNSWPGKDHDGPRIESIGVPSVIQIGDNGDDLKWGYQVHGEVKTIGDLKLALQDNLPLRYYPKPAPVLASIYATLAKENSDLFSTTKMVARYLEAVYLHALKEIAAKEMTTVMKFRRAFVITVPAAWSDGAKRRLRLALTEAHQDFKNADILLSEPEAAALFIADSREVISYEVTAVDQKLRLEELNATTGGDVRSAGISPGFSRHLKSVLQQDDFEALDKKTNALAEIVGKLSRNLKLGFSSVTEWDSANKNVWIELGMPLTSDPRKDIENNKLKVTGALLKSIYGSLADETTKLVDKQIAEVMRKKTQSPEAIFLVGGFGMSSHLRNHLKETIKLIPIIDIGPQDAWSAVAKGAVLHRMPKSPTVGVTIAPSSIGVRSLMPLIPSDDDDKLKREGHFVTDEREDVVRVEKMTWYILKGMQLDRERKVVFQFYRDLPLDFKVGDLVFTDILEESNAELPPMYPWRDGHIKQRCELQSNFRHLEAQKDRLKKRTDRVGNQYYSVYYDLLVTVKSANLEFSAVWDNQEIGVKNVGYDLA